MPSNKKVATETFYDSLAEDYDEMTGGARRLNRAIEDLRAIVEGLRPRHILDAGCGTGTDSLALASLGCEVVGIDGSNGMIEIAQKRGEGVPGVVFQKADLRTLEGLSDGWADFTLCRGNTLPHLLTSEDLRQSLSSFARVTRSGGLLVLGWLNYVPVLGEKRRLIGATGRPENRFLRFYDFLEDGMLQFNQVTISGGSDKAAPLVDWRSTQHMPWSADDVGMLLLQTGWEDLEIGSDLKRGDFDPDASRDVFYFAIRS